MYTVTLNRKQIARIFEQMRVSKDGCWEWTGRLTPAGYGTIGVNGGSHRLHRLIYAWLFGPLPVGHGWHVDHLVCDNRKCFNPAHLKLVTARVNILRGSGVTAQQVRRTHCPQGHPYSGANLAIRSDGARRRCRACSKAQGKAKYWASKSVRASVYTTSEKFLC